MVRRIARGIPAAILCAWLTACTTPAPVPPVPICEPTVQIQQVKVPVPVWRTPPPELLSCPALPPSPAFVSPTDPHATSALTGQGEQQLRDFINAMAACPDAWRAWALTKDQPK